MRLLIDTVNVSSPGGMTLVRELPRCVERGISPGSSVVLLAAPNELDLVDHDQLEIVELERTSGWTGVWRWSGPGLVEQVRRHRADVVLCVNGIVGRPLVRAAGCVTYINNMLPFTPELVRSKPWTSPLRVKLELVRRAYVAGCKRAHAVVAPSAFGLDTADRFAGGVVAGKGFVAPNPIPEHVKIDPSSPPGHPYDGRPYLFYLSAVYWYKNHHNLVEAYRRAVAGGAELPDLLIAGPVAERDYMASVERAIEEGGLRDRVRYLGKIPFERIPAYLHHATVNVFPSTCETSSLVQTEILGAHGVQACSNIGPMPEVAGGTAELFDPHDPDDIARVLARLCSDEARRRELRELAAARAATLTVERCWEEIWKAAEHAHAAAPGRPASN